MPPYDLGATLSKRPPPNRSENLIDEDGLSGATGNPTIFEHAITHDTTYDEQMQHLIREGKSAQDINVRQRTDQIDVFTTETSCLAIVWATIQDIRLHKISV
jgi:transaldolase